jgi:tRNA pseudouridine55 synthase
MQAAPRARVQRRPVHGVVLLDKPLGLSSNQALQKAKWLLRAEKAGHTGTLDPLATGVLPLCFGAATKFSQLHLDADKAYTATLQLGTTTTTGDAEGDITATLPVDEAQLAPDHLARVAQHFTGPQQQLPPMYSALKKDGKALYEYARAGQEVEREPRSITIHSLTLQRTGPATLELEVLCSKGTYVRTLAEDIGRALGCGAHLIALRRTRTGTFGLDACTTLEALEALPEAQRQASLLPVDVLLQGHATVTLQEQEAGRFLSGLRRRGHWPDCEQVQVRATQPAALLGTAHTKAGELIPGRLLSPIEIQQILEQTLETTP